MVDIREKLSRVDEIMGEGELEFADDVGLDEAQKTYHVRVTKYFRGIGDQGRIVKANSEKEAIKIAAKMMKKKPSYLEAELV